MQIESRKGGRIKTTEKYSVEQFEELPWIAHFE